MKYRTHLFGGVLAGISTFNAVADKINVDPNQATENIIFMSGAILGSLFPDIDHRGSYIGRRAKIASAVTSTIFGHRGATHAPIAMGVFTLLLYLISTFFTTSILAKLWFIGFYIGILSHIFLDMLTKGGVPLFYPFTKKKIALTKMKTGNMGETVVIFVMLIACIYLFSTNSILPQLIGLK